MDTTQALWFTVLFTAILVWFALAARLYRLLREDHGEVYEWLGSPSLFLNNSPRKSWLSLRFLVSGNFRNLGDQRVTRLCGLMRVFLVAYLAWFIGPVVWMLLSR
jgi:hypothetical protein